MGWLVVVGGGGEWVGSLGHTLQCVVLTGMPMLEANTTVRAEASSIVNPLWRKVGGGGRGRAEEEEEVGRGWEGEEEGGGKETLFTGYGLGSLGVLVRQHPH